jgi:methyl-accepting chemotaxis protein
MTGVTVRPTNHRQHNHPLFLEKMMKTPLKIRHQLMLLASSLLLLVALFAMAGVLAMKHDSAAIQSVYVDRVVPLAQLKKVADAYAVDIVDATHKFRDGGMTGPQALASIEAAKKVIVTQWGLYQGTAMVPQEQALLDKITPMMRTADAATAEIVRLIGANDKEAVRVFAGDKMYPEFDPMQGVIGEMIQVQLDVSLGVYEQSVANTRTMAIAYGVAFVVALVLGLFVAYRISHGLLRRLGGEPHEVRAVAHAVTEGDLSYGITLRPGDTISVMAAMDEMCERLSGVVRGVRLNAESVATASAEIAQGNHDLSGRTEQQAASLEQASAAMEELGSTARQNADNARLANQLAATASTVAVQGGSVVSQVVQTMKDINESSKKISDIIGVIDGIAFQTNILALNAAVEAARAGEQGRGFAVVAGEVRNLAQRSAEAAKEIKGLISASVDRVGQGTQLVDQAGSTMQEIVTSIKRVTDIVGEISSASHEQNTGVGQVSESVVHMDQATQQNAALVEQSAAAASSLRQQADELVHSVAVFRLKGTGGEVKRIAVATPAAAPALSKPASLSANRLALAKSVASSAAPMPLAKKSLKNAGLKPVPLPKPQLGHPPAAVGSRPVAATAGAEGDWESF